MSNFFKDHKTVLKRAIKNRCIFCPHIFFFSRLLPLRGSIVGFDSYCHLFLFSFYVSSDWNLCKIYHACCLTKLCRSYSYKILVFLSQAAVELIWVDEWFDFLFLLFQFYGFSRCWEAFILLFIIFDNFMTDPIVLKKPLPWLCKDKNTVLISTRFVWIDIIFSGKMNNWLLSLSYLLHYLYQFG